MADGSRWIKREFSDSAVGRRLALCAELGGLHRHAKGGSSAAIKAKIKQRAHAILRLLLPGELGGDMAADTLYSVASAKRFFADGIESAKSASDAEKLRVALLQNDLQGMVNHVLAATLDNSPLVDWPKIPGDFIKIDPESPHTADSPAMPVLDEAKALGALPEGLAAATTKVIEEIKFLKFTRDNYDKFDPELAAALVESERRAQEYMTAVLYPARDEVRKLSGDEQRVAHERYNQLYREYHEKFTDPAYAIHDKLVASYGVDRQRKIDAISATVAEYRAAVMDESDVSEERATEWVSRQVTITPTAAARLKKQGYAPAQVLKDAAEFYRLCRGRIEKVVIDSRGDRRANASSIDSHGSAGVINLGSEFDKRVLWHELGHHVEADPVAAMAARLFIRLRSDDGKVYSLRKLTENKFYGAGEMAYRNGFFSPYVGKVYRDGKTEVFSMGLESFSDPYTLAQRIARDPQTFEFVIGYLRSPKTALHALHLAMRQTTREGNESAQAQALDEAKERISSEAAKITDFVESSQLPDGLNEDSADMIRRVGGKVVGYLTKERDGNYYVMAKGKGRHPVTGRKVPAYWFFKVDPASGRVAWSRAHVPAGETEIARISLWYWRQHGWEPNYKQIAAGLAVVSEE